jgi:HlyD family type I secretion membrane fusion protein
MSLSFNKSLPIQRAADPGPPEAKAPDDSLRGTAIFGWAIILGFFGVFGLWSVLAPLNGAVVGQGVVKTEGNRKSVQHLDGGIVKEMRVKEGDTVKAGEVVVVLDETQARAEFDILTQMFLVSRATEERLRAEYSRFDALVMPVDLKARGKDPVLEGIWNGQIHQFESRRNTLEGQRKVLQEKIAQLESQIKGGEAQVRSFEDQYKSVQAEMLSIKPLVDQGLIARPRFLQLERSGIALEGQAADTQANIAKARQAISEQQQQIAQLDNDRMTEVARDLRDTQAKLLEIIPKVMNAQAVLNRMEVRSPYAGRVVALSVFSIGGVINRGDKIMDIVPDQESLVVEAQVGVDDISLIRPDMPADIHLTAYKQRITPMVKGQVISVSADRLVENRTGAPYYTALVRINEGELEKVPNVKLYSGMAAMVMIPTVERTAFDYFVGPLMMSFRQSFRQL